MAMLTTIEPGQHRIQGPKLPTQNFPGGPVVKTLPSSAGDATFISEQGTKISHALGN